MRENRSKTYRPRTTRDRAERVQEAAAQLNGAPVNSLDDALQLLCRYLDVLTASVDECPECGSSDIVQENARLWRCYSCDEFDGELFNAYSYLDVADRDEATLIPKSTIQRRYGDE